MKFSKVFSILEDLRLSIQVTFKPTLLAIFRSPTLIFRPRALSRLIFYNIWVVYGGATNGYGDQIKTDLITPSADGVVLDIGAGLGYTAIYLAPNRVTKYIALEPNVLMHPHIRETAARAGFTEDLGTLLILSCGAEEFNRIASATGGENEVDTIISVLTLCSVPNPERTVQHLTDKILKPGGQLIFYEHVRSKRPDVQFWQKFWSPIWKVLFDNCNLDRPTDDYVRNIKDCWEEFPAVDATGKRIGIWRKEEDDEESLFGHQIGRLIKRST